ncbi:MAG: hypothetical protein Q4D56_01120 [Bacteroides sp.]|nr:hypothetical protein [Bacteroides sp.]
MLSKKIFLGTNATTNAIFLKILREPKVSEAKIRAIRAKEGKHITGSRTHTLPAAEFHRREEAALIHLFSALLPACPQTKHVFN